MNKDKDILLLSIFTFLTVTLWIFFELVKTAKTTTVAVSTKQLIAPFNPSIDTELIEKIINRNSLYEK